MQGQPPPPSYVMLEGKGGNNVRHHPPPYRRNVPRYGSHSKKRSCCFRCICCCCCFLFLLIIILAGGGYYFYANYKPKAPKYKIQELIVQVFEVQPDFSLKTELLAKVRAENQNTNIGFIYGEDGSASVHYKDTVLCTGKLPSFEQGHQNTTIMEIFLKGTSPFGSGLQDALAQNKHKNRIPLLVKVKAPMKVVVGTYAFRQFVAYVNCNVLVDNLEKDKPVKVLKNDCRPVVKF